MEPGYSAELAKEWGRLLRKLRRARPHKPSQGWLAQKVGVHKDLPSKWEHGLLPRYEKLAPIRTALKLTSTEWDELYEMYVRATKGESEALQPVPNPQQHAMTQTVHAEEALRNEAKASLGRRGRLRTAFPTDLSFTELFDHDLYVEPRVLEGGTSPAGNELLVEAVLRGLVSGHCYLLLGEPGSGKSYLSYLLQRRLQERGYPTLACDLLDLLSLVGERERVFGQWGGLDTAQDLPVIIDSLDEPTSTAQELRAARLLAEKLAKRGSVLCICRREDYETRIFHVIPPESFDKILYVARWRLEVEVTQFVERLGTKGYVKARELLAALDKYPSLQALVGRPLHARMLTYVWHDNVTSLQEDGTTLTHLYEEYFRKYATATTPPPDGDGTIYRPLDVVNTWADIAWTLFSRALYTRSRIEALVLDDITDKLPLALQRAARSLLQSTANPGPAAHQFIHYSLYEFLVAISFATRLCEACERRDHTAAMMLFHQDMTREMRHYTVNLIPAHSTRIADRLEQFLAELYSLTRGREAPNRQTLSACNLMVYFLARCSGSQASAAYIRKLLDPEADPFLRTSLYWAACRVNDVDVVLDYYRVLQADAGMRELNRGYHRYYYGDIDRTLSPPYSDASPETSWSRTRASMVEMMGRNSYSTQAPCKRLFDAVTFLDLVQYHRTPVPNEEYSVLTTALSTLGSAGEKYEQLSSTLRRALDALMHGMHLSELTEIMSPDE